MRNYFSKWLRQLFLSLGGRLVVCLIFSLEMGIPSIEAKDLLVDKLSAYRIELKQVRPATCLEAQFDDKTKQKFLQAVCIFHNKSTELENDRVITLLQQAQLSGLPPVHQNFSTFLEGLTHCRQANIYFEKYKTGNGTSSLKKGLLEKARFCRERRLALASFSDVSWEYAYFDYEPVSSHPKFTLNDRLQEMSACYGGVLDSSLHAECGLIDTMSDSEIENVVAGAVDETMKKYFTGVEGPITAMFARKIKRAEGLLSSAAANIEQLKQAVLPVNKQYASFAKTYQKAKEESLERIFEEYRTSVLKANSILDEFNRWKGGLFITSENVNLLPLMKERKMDIEDEIKRVSEAGLLERPKKMVEDLAAILQGEKESEKTMNQLCHIYFCEFLNKRALLKLNRVCRQPRMKDNPLCVDTNNNLISGNVTVEFNGVKHTKSVSSVCKEVGLQEKYIKVGLENQDVNACLGELL